MMQTNPREPVAPQRAAADASTRAATPAVPVARRSRARYAILALLFISVVINYIDRANLSIAIPLIKSDLHLNAVVEGLILSAFGWSYAFMQIPGGWLIDRLGPRLTYGVSLAVWSIVTMLQGIANSAGMLIGLRLSLGITEAPAFPVNSRVVGAWFPARERGSATAIYTAGEYVGLAFLLPLLAFIITALSWQIMFAISGFAGLVWAGVWFWLYRDPRHSRRVNEAELTYIREGGGLAESAMRRAKVTWPEAIQLFQHRQLLGIYLGQFAEATALWFFLTWFPTYLVTARHLSIIKAGGYAAIPYIAAFFGVLFAGGISDWLIRLGFSLGTARKIPIIVGLLLTSTIVAANYISSLGLVIFVLSIAFFAQGMSAITWTLVSDIAPRELMGLAGGVFNFCGNLGAIATPLVVGFILAATSSFNGALIYVAAVAFGGALSYIFIVGKVQRIELKQRPVLGL